MTPLLYLPGEAPLPYTPAFSCQALHLTQILLRQSQPATAQHIAKLLESLSRLCTPKGSVYRCAIDNRQLLAALSAPMINNIIAGLTQLGQQWLHSHKGNSTSCEGLRALLNQWIDYGDWMLSHAQTG